MARFELYWVLCRVCRAWHIDLFLLFLAFLDNDRFSRLKGFLSFHSLHTFVHNKCYVDNSQSSSTVCLLFSLLFFTKRPSITVDTLIWGCDLITLWKILPGISQLLLCQVLYSSFPVGTRIISPMIIETSKLNFLSKCKITGQHVRQFKDFSRQYSILTRHCSLTGCYFKPWTYKASGVCYKIYYIKNYNLIKVKS